MDAFHLEYGVEAFGDGIAASDARVGVASAAYGRARRRAQIGVLDGERVVRAFAFGELAPCLAGERQLDLAAALGVRAAVGISLIT
jgi:hypothetical protein